ncbi:hypothetical protein WN48_05554 [Eufriesea mexicana]|uniref:Uncharacterized protein n=1 Tax=Eufriesea mexicana TaxID=516756 RepID=A0A310SL99_9HYME|nr:hypothetical protein WN48_05554 [Eufriesea mexicana]
MCGRPLEKINKNDFSFAVTKESLQQMCPDFEASLKCIQSYSFNCLQQKQRVRFNQWYTSTNMAIMEMCQEGPFQDKFLQYLPCMQKVEPEYELCYRKFEKTAQNVSRTLRANLNDTVKSLCCAGAIRRLEMKPDFLLEPGKKEMGKCTKKGGNEDGEQLLTKDAIPSSDEDSEIDSRLEGRVPRKNLNLAGSLMKLREIKRKCRSMVARSVGRLTV